MTKRYYLKKKCERCKGKGECQVVTYYPKTRLEKPCKTCKGTGEVKGAEVTELIVRVLNEIDGEINNKKHISYMDYNTGLIEAKQFILKELIVEQSSTGGK